MIRKFSLMLLIYICLLTMSCGMFDLIEPLDESVPTNTSQFYKIVLRNNPLYVLECAAIPSNGVNVRIGEDKGTDLQQWKLIDIGGGYYKIVLRNYQNYCIDEADITPIAGSNVQVWSYDGNDRQKWKFIDIGSGYYEIELKLKNNLTTFCLDESQETPADGSNVQVWYYLPTDRQQWQLVPVE
jgi:mannan endo-1,4-beta-mannosidase